jgi:Domain of unknown function (DUF6265)
MRRIEQFRGLALLAFGLLVASDGRAAGIDRVAWLAGCWRGGADGRVIDEQWMAPRAGLMLGMGRTASPTNVRSYEQMRIEADGDALVFTAKPSGQPEDSFRALPGTDDALVFENLAHPFPQRIVYRLAGDGSLQARIEGMRGDRVVGIDYPMQRVSCAAAP